MWSFRQLIVVEDEGILMVLGDLVVLADWMDVLLVPFPLCVKLHCR